MNPWTLTTYSGRKCIDQMAEHLKSVVLPAWRERFGIETDIHKMDLAGQLDKAAANPPPDPLNVRNPSRNGSILKCGNWGLG